MTPRSPRNLNASPAARGTRAALVAMVIAAAITALFMLLTRGGEGTPVESSDDALAHHSSVRSERRGRADAPALPGLHERTPHEEPPAGSPFAAPSVVTRPGTAGRLEGEVRSRVGGLPVPHAELSFERDGVLQSVHTDADGQYRLETQQPAQFRLRAITAPGYLPYAPAWGDDAVTARLTPGTHVQGATLWLTPAALYTGLVVDAQARPVPNAEVRLYAAASDAALMPLEDRFRSDRAGTFTFQAPRDSVLEATAARHGRGRARIDFGAEVSKRVVITLTPAADGARLALSGRITGPDGAPVEQAVVEAHAEGDPFAEGLIRIPAVAASDEDGQYRLEGLSAGRYRVTASHGELARASREGVEAGDLHVDLSLSAGGRLVVNARDEAGAPLSAFTIKVWQKRGPLGHDLVRAMTALEPSGRVELRGLPEGSLLVLAESPGRAPSAETQVLVTFEPAPAAELTLTLGRGQTLRGRVSDTASKAPLAGARVSVEGRGVSSDEQPLRSSVETDAAGRFELPGVRAGQATLLVSAPDHHGRVLPVGVLEGKDPAVLEVSLRPVAKDETPQVELAGLGLVLAAHEDALSVGAVAPQGGGAEAGIQVGDAIVSVSGTPVVELGFERAITAMRGPEDSSVALGVRRKDGQTFAVVARRRIVRM